MRNKHEQRDIQDTIACYLRGVSNPAADGALVLGARLDAYTQGNFDRRRGVESPPPEFARHEALLVEWQRGFLSVDAPNLNSYSCEQNLSI